MAELSAGREASVPRSDYSVAQKVVHWLMALVIMLDLFVAQKFGGVLESWDRLESRSDHATLGSIVLMLFLVRLLLLYRNGFPQLPAGMSEGRRRFARAAHVLLYVAIGALIASGLITAINAAAPITLFGALDITVGQSTEQTFDFLRQFHELATWTIIALIVLHVLAALYHQFVARDGALARMLRFWRSD